jgi:hypothetical protein
VREGMLRSVSVKDALREDTEIWSRPPSDEVDRSASYLPATELT